MNARETILAAIRRANPPASPLPDVSLRRGAPDDRDDLVRRFLDAAAITGASVTQTTSAGAADVIDRLFSGTGRRVSTRIADTDELATASRHSFADTDVFICSAVLGVAENGAVWLPLSRLRYRSAVFLATNVVVVLGASTLVRDFHAAYESIDLASEAFGVFVAGPSKTADIEQALVIGAHGAKALTLVLIDDE